jgi:hypothetical protein
VYYFDHTPTTAHVPVALPFMVLAVPERKQRGVLKGRAVAVLLPICRTTRREAMLRKVKATMRTKD